MKIWKLRLLILDCLELLQMILIAMSQLVQLGQLVILIPKLITGQPAAKRQPNNTFTFLLQWVTPKVKNENIKSIIDSRVQGKYSVDSAGKFLQVAMSCTAPTASQRPDISQVVYELRGCLELEMSKEVTSDQPTNSSSSMSTSALQFDSDFSILSGR
ncbi:LRR receptor-like serine/threonine-protein kinase IOS1 isoform X2 [Neltuma alba]|uniref:LRR receptor-like serine/threonine-protein kinase IOS1 isoform X2 n=1 Tax=Neltuma alba TaxID=207710 RepID=UPI0010A330B6|nr:LRR receptor-like serine/threonine-protein kinase IOS1 isoform X2 [Prosopis alba]